jgi:hypothetical protein
MFVGIGVGVGRQRFAGSFADSYSARVLADGGTIESLSCVSSASTLLQQASLLLVPSGYKSGVVYSALPNNGNGDLTWSRNSVANRTQSNGNIGSVGANVPRLSYMYGSCPALLLEPQRTNLALYSEQFNDSYWAKTAITVTANSTTSPDGTTNADTLTENTATSDHKTFKVFTVTASTTYTLSAYAKKNGRNLVYLFDAYTFRGAIFNLDTLAITNIGSGLTNASITSVGNGWYRLSGSVTPSGTLMSLEIGITNSTSSTSYLGDGTSGAFIWGGQLEIGAYPTTYIPTTTATVTRIADTFTRNNIYTNGLITSSGGTWFVELKNNVAYTRDQGSTSLCISSNSSDAFANSTNIEISSPTNGRLNIVKRVSGTATTIYTTLTDTVKIVAKWDGSNLDLFVNGSKISLTSGQRAFAVTTMEFLKAFGADVPKFIQQMALYPTPLSDSDCITITS